MYFKTVMTPSGETHHSIPQVEFVTTLSDKTHHSISNSIELLSSSFSLLTSIYKNN